MTKEEAFKEINDTQEYYVNELINRILDPANELLKEDNFTSDTGTGKSVMIKLLANKLPNYFFLVTTLSKGQLDIQTADKLSGLENVVVFGLNKFTSASKLKTKDLLDLLKNKAREHKIIWIRDEGHIHTNKWAEALEDVCFKKINISATNKVEGLRTNFMHTMMLRTVHQAVGTPEDAIRQLVLVKKQHKKVMHYNPCGIFRSLDSSLTANIISLCKKYNLKHIDLTNNDDYDMSELCKDDCDTDVIINKFKVVEGIDLRRAHVLYMTNVPKNFATTIQVIGRCRRNALLYSDSIDIFESKNSELLSNTMQCYVFNNKIDSEVPTDKDGNLVTAFCDTISVEQLRTDVIFELNHGRLLNGIKLAEATEKDTGKYVAKKDTATGFNILTKQTTKQGKYLTFYNKLNREYNEAKDCIEVEIFKVDKNGYLYTDGSFDKTTCTRKAIIDATSIKRKIYYVWGENWYDKQCLETTDINGKKIYIQPASKNISRIGYYDFNQIFNDKEQAIIGVDTFHYIKDKASWIPERAVTKKIKAHTKLQSFIATTYSSALLKAQEQCFNGKNNFNFTDNKLNKCLGYCVEYYSKYLVYGQEYLQPHLSQVFKEAHTNKLTDGMIVRACILKYKQNMIECFGKAEEALIPTISMDQLILQNLQPFITTVIELGTRTAIFVKKELHITNILKAGDKIHSPILSTLHISALADYINHDTIIDIKTTSNITIDYIKQVLAYHYLSTKRSDLDIKHLIVYDAVTDKCARIDFE